MNRKIFHPVNFLFCAVFLLSASPGRAQFEDSNLKDSLVDLKQSAKDVVTSNENLKERIQRLRERIPVLESQIKTIQAEKKELGWQRQQMKEQYKAVSDENIEAQKRLFTLNDKLNKYYKEQARAGERYAKRESEIESFRGRAAQLRSAIQALEDKIAMQEPIKVSGAGREVLGLQNEIAQASAAIDDLNRRYAIHREAYDTALAQLESFQKINHDLSGDISRVEEEIQTAQNEEGRIKSKWEDMQTDQEESFDSLLRTVEELTQRKSKLENLIKQSVNVHNELTAEFNKEKGNLFGTVEKLNEEHERLLEQEKILQESLKETQQLLGKFDETENMENRFTETKKKLDNLLARQNDLKQSIKANQDDIEQAGRDHRSLENELKQLQREVEFSQQQTEKTLGKRSAEFEDLIRQSKGRLQDRDAELERMLEANMKPQEILENTRQEAKELQGQIARLQEEIKTIQAEPVKIQQELERMKAEQAKQKALLDAEIAQLGVYRDKLIFVIQEVDRRLDRDILTDREFARSEDSLKTHLSVLQTENNFLKREEETLLYAVNTVRVDLGYPPMPKSPMETPQEMSQEN